MAENVEKKNSVNDMTVQLIRDEIRDEITFSRKLQRDAKLSKNRSALGQSIDNIVYTEEFVREIVKKLKRKSLNTADYRKLQTALIQSENHINAFFKVDNASQSLSRDLSGRSTQAKLAAANCCCNLSLGNPKACVTLCKFVGPYLIAELESTNQPLAEVCAWTIGNLTTANEKAFSILHAQNCIKFLINLARQSSDTLFPAASYALLRYIHSGFGTIEEKDIIEIGEIVATRYPTICDVDTIWLLALLSSLEFKNINHLIKCVPAVCDFLIKASYDEDENIEKLSAALRIICNLVSEPTGKVVDHLFNNDFSENRTFLNNLLTHEFIHIRKETLWLIGNLYNHCMDSVRHQIKMIVYSLPSVKLALNSLDKLSCEAQLSIEEQTSLNSLDQ